MGELSALILILTIYKESLFSEVLFVFLKPVKAFKYCHAYSDLSHCPILHFTALIFIVMCIFAYVVEAAIQQ